LAVRKGVLVDLKKVLVGLGAKAHRDLSKASKVITANRTEVQDNVSRACVNHGGRDGEVEQNRRRRIALGESVGGDEADEERCGEESQHYAEGHGGSPGLTLPSYAGSGGRG
jgi:hypothetical protein